MLAGVTKYLDISGTALTAPTTPGTDTTSAALPISVDEFNHMLNNPGAIVVRYQVSTTIKRAVAHVIEGASGHIDIVESGTLNLITYAIKNVSGSIKVVGSIVKAAAPA